MADKATWTFFSPGKQYRSRAKKPVETHPSIALKSKFRKPHSLPRIELTLQAALLAQTSLLFIGKEIHISWSRKKKYQAERMTAA